VLGTDATLPTMSGARRAGAYLLGAVRQAPDLDIVLAMAALVALLIDPLFDPTHSHVTLLGVVLAVATSAPLVVRRRFPLGALATVVPLLLLCLAVFHPNRAAVGVVMLAVFTVGVEGGRLRSLVVGGLMAPVVAAAVFITSNDGFSAVTAIANFALVLIALAAGEALRARRALLANLADEAEREREAAAQHRFDQERLRLAHELHDVVGHALVAINVRASAAAHHDRKTGTSAGDDVTPLDEIAATSAAALTELRTTLKSLRATPDDEGLAPATQNVDDLAGLAAGLQRAGLDVELDIGGLPPTLPDRVAHAGYRIVQEGLTNVLRHSNATHATVRVGVENGTLSLQVVDRGPAKPSAESPTGHGLQGMKERAAVLGGSCESGTFDGGGWRVSAVLPLDGATR
jgi:signal transduction histidine kinase